MFAPGTEVRVRLDWPETRGRCHIRTPHYVRGASGKIVRHLGDFANPENLAFARPAETVPLYHVRFDPKTVWPDTSADDIVIEIFQHWLELA
ncbi:MAG TPA: SH3-like domain-containing protein [Acidiphilium sp.]